MTAFHAFKKLFRDNKVNYRSWELAKQDDLQPFDGDIIVIGDENGGPYTQFCFNDEGALVSADSCTDLDADKQQVVVDSVANTITTYNYKTGKRTKYNPETGATITEEY